MKSIFLLLLTVFIASCTNHSQELVYFVNNYEEITKTKDTSPTLSARILKLRESGECDNNVCPKEVLYIAISEFGEYPEQNLYITEKADKWSFVKWNHIPELGETDQTITLTLKRVNHSNELLYQVKMDLNAITYNIIK